MDRQELPAMCRQTQIPSATRQPMTGTIQPWNGTSQWDRAMIVVSSAFCESKPGATVSDS